MDIIERNREGMTENEIKKCEELMYKAIRDAKEAMWFYEDYSSLLKQNAVAASIDLRKADQKYGYAAGIRQTLTVLGFEHDNMKILEDLTCVL